MIYAEDQYKATDKLSIVLGARYDKNPLAEGQVSPRAGLLYTIKEGHVIMLSATQAFRSPNLLDSYFNYTVPFSPVTTASLTGNQNLKPESVTSYQAEYRANISKKINGKLAVFYNHYSDFITANYVEQFYPPGSFFAGLPQKFTSIFRQ